MAAEHKVGACLVRKLNQGDSKAFDQLFAEKHQQVYAYCLRLVKSEPAAEEIMMDVFLTIWRKRELMRADQSLNALLFKITKDLSINYLKKSAREQALRTKFQQQWLHPTHNPTETQMLSQEYDRIASQAIEQLPPQRKTIFTMRRHLDMSPDEIAQQLGISKSTVKGQLAKAAKFLREYVMTHTDISFVGALGLLLNLFSTRW